ncbi:hypothetical protein [Alistipes sp.]|uniref:hypothetical protein n=1 Tax=Alistipes sp. TaxID=1872444 RepID=UPI0028526A00|nr:hypothetical protein [Alistipes sp.]
MNPSKAITVSVQLSIVVICLGDALPLKHSERNSHPPASFGNPMAKYFLPLIV